MENSYDFEEDKPFRLFGRDISKIPCFRNSWLYGISSGFGSGLLTFMFTSRIRLATHMVFGTTCAVTLTYFTFCRVQLQKTNRTVDQIRGLLYKVQGEKFTTDTPQIKD